MRAILQAPHPALRAVAAPITRFDEALAALADDLLEAMYAAPGRGLAAPQVGVALRLFVLDPTWRDGAPAPAAYANPRLLWASDEASTRDEGCLSLPGRAYPVTRPARVRLAWQGLDGAPHEAEFDGFAAAAVQHEVDHLDGVLVSDRASCA